MQIFAPDYVVPRDKSAVVKEIKAAASAAGTVYLATDPDREGEAIAWHLMHAAAIPQERIRRVVFHEVTENAVRRAFEESDGMANDNASNRVGGIDVDLVNAYQARRVLDRLVGYRLRPRSLEQGPQGACPPAACNLPRSALLLNAKPRSTHSCPQEYWEIDAALATQAATPEDVAARYRSELGGSRAVVIPNQENADRILDDLRASSYQIASVRRRETTRRPGPAVHHVHAPAGGVPQAAVYRPPDHDRRAAAL